MKATLSLEAIGYNTYKSFSDFDRLSSKWGYPNDPAPFPCWVAEIIRWYPLDQDYSRRYLKYSTDYSKSNSKGSRGVYFWYILESGRIYQIKEPQSWSRTKLYFCKVSDNGEIIEIAEDEARQCLKERCSE
jgi:hypothetical protein